MSKDQTTTVDTVQEDQPNTASVVVGFDGSSGAMAALRWAYGEAKLRKAPLRVIHAVDSFASYPSIAVDVGAIHQRAAQLLDEAVREIAGDDEVDGIERLLFDGSAAKVLVTAVHDNDLLVVGSRGHGGFAGLLLGSVSQQCIQHAPCPVVVIRHGS
jgi:nucleotide-binding universal stress UspA family protein